MYNIKSLFGCRFWVPPKTQYLTEANLELSQTCLPKKNLGLVLGF